LPDIKVSVHMPMRKLLAVVIATVASAVTAVGIVRIVITPDAPATAVVEATVDSLTARVAAAGWTAMDHDMSGSATGYQMPPAMMPGMPEGDDQRLSVSVTVVNTSDETRLLRPGEEFALRAGKESEPVAPHSDTFGDLPRLAPHNAVTGILFFDLPPAELIGTPAWIEWTHGDTANRLTIPMDGASAPPSHSHNP
jgi:hypothetical protein